MTLLELDLTTARRVAVRAQLLDQSRPTGLLDLVTRLTFLQIDPTAAISPNADLVAWSRLGDQYRVDDLTRALEVDRTLFEFAALIRPMSDLPLFLAGMSGVPRSERARSWFEANEAFRHDVMARFAAEGALSSRDIPDTSSVPWTSTGWSNNRNVGEMLEILHRRGDIAISHRRGRERYWDLAERVYPADAVALPLAEAEQVRAERRLRALGIARTKAPEQGLEPIHVDSAGLEATVAGVPGTWRIDPLAIEAASREAAWEGRTALLSPFDRLVYDRQRALSLFGFDYALEMYKPAEKRRWGYFALPVLHDDRLVGKVDAAVDRKAGLLAVRAIHEDEPFASDTRAAVLAELDSLATWLGVERQGP